MEQDNFWEQKSHELSALDFLEVDSDSDEQAFNEIKHQLEKTQHCNCPEGTLTGVVVPTLRGEASTELLDFFHDCGLFGFLPLVREYFKRGGFVLCCGQNLKVNSVSDMARIEPSKLRNFFLRADLYAPSHHHGNPLPRPSNQEIDRCMAILHEWKQR